MIFLFLYIIVVFYKILTNSRLIIIIKKNIRYFNLNNISEKSEKIK